MPAADLYMAVVDEHRELHRGNMSRFAHRSVPYSVSEAWAPEQMASLAEPALGQAVADSFAVVDRCNMHYAAPEGTADNLGR